MIMTNLTKFYNGIKSYHNKKYKDYFHNFKHPILEQMNIKFKHPYKEYEHLRGIVLTIL